MKEHFLSILRQRETGTEAFRAAAANLATWIAHDAAAQVQLTPRTIHTPLGESSGSLLDKKVVLVPILRAGLAFLPSFLQLFPKASVGFLGIRRDEKTAIPHLYYENLPEIGPDTYVFLLDPMLATGGTANLALDHIIQKGASPHLTLLANFLAAKPGLQAVRERHPEVKLYTAAIDPQLDSKKFIVPGLGDFGNRYFGT